MGVFWRLSWAEVKFSRTWNLSSYPSRTLFCKYVIYPTESPSEGQGDEDSDAVRFQASRG